MIWSVVVSYGICDAFFQLGSYPVMTSFIVCLAITMEIGCDSVYGHVK